MQLVLVSVMSLHRRTGHADGRTSRMTNPLEVECMAQSTKRLIIAMCYSFILCLITDLGIPGSPRQLLLIGTPAFFRILAPRWWWETYLFNARRLRMSTSESASVVFPGRVEDVEKQVFRYSTAHQRTCLADPHHRFRYNDGILGGNP